jgi:hypothetical protein
LKRECYHTGASTKICWFPFGSISEIIDDLNSHSEEEVIQLIENVGKLQLLRKRVGDHALF